MAKKIRFPLIMDRDAEARNLEELRANFSLRAVLEYYENGKLLTWLENLYLLDETDQIRELDKKAPDFQRRLCGIFQVEYTRDMDPKVIEQRKKRLERLRAVTDEDQFYRMIDYVAFDQEELAELLDEEETTICLCREEGKDFTFTIPASCKGVTYIGVPTHSGQKPRVRISGGTLDDIENLGITVTSCDMEEPMLLSHKSADKTAQMLMDNNALPEGGIVVATGSNAYGQCNVESWKNIISISCGVFHTVGLKRDGTVIATGNNADGQCEVKKWHDVVSISCGHYHTIGLKKDGTVVATGRNGLNQCNVELWHDIVSISCGYYHTVGLKKGGTVITTGNNTENQCEVELWHDIVFISCGLSHTVGLKKDGTVIATGRNDFNQCNVELWHDIVSISCGYYHTIGLKKDGTVVSTRNSGLNQCDVKKWRDIASIFCGESHTIGLKKDGAVVSTGNNDLKQCDVDLWHDIVLIACGSKYTVGIQKPQQ